MTNKALVEALLPCPFCGGEGHWSPTYVDADMPGTVTCANGCGGTVICSGNQATRIAAWNSRTALASSGNAPGDDKGLVEAARTIAATHLDADMSDVFRGGYDSSPEYAAALDGLRHGMRLTALSSGNEVAKVVGWLLADADQTEAESRKIIENSHGLSPRDIQDWRDLVATKRGIANAIARGAHLASDAAPLTGGGGNG